MSGTSIDGIDAALIRYTNHSVELLATHEHAIPDAVRQQIVNLSASGPEEIELLGALDRTLGFLFARAALTLLDSAGSNPQAITAIGSHGQTVRHRPPSGGHAPEHSFTLQIGDPNSIAEITGITTIADFRRRDIAAGGEGAPLAPAFHAATMGSTGHNRAIVNIGGFANVSCLQGHGLTHGSDTGPGNTLLDAWISKHRNERFDRHGKWAASGHVTAALLEKLLAHPYFALSGKRSTGKEGFNLTWLEQTLTTLPALDPVDVQATLAEFTATTITKEIANCATPIDEIYLCGGGVHNQDLVTRITRLAGPRSVASTQTLGMDPDWVEAMAFAWLAARCLDNLPGNAPVVTGAAGLRVLGGIYPG